MSARKLHHYFETHTIKVLTNQSLNDIFGNRDNSDQISKWVMELLEYVVDFEKKCDKITNFSRFYGRLDGAKLPARWHHA
jgi:hypothetical protein